MQKDSVQKIQMPELGEGVTEGELTKWLVALGDEVQADQPIAEVMTDKASMEVPSPVTGVVESFLAKEGDAVQVGQALLSLKGASAKPESLESSAEVKKPPAKEDKPRVAEGPSVEEKEKGEEGTLATPSIEEGENKEEGTLATPFTRRLARKLGVSLNQVQGSGLAGRITKEDIVKHAPSSGVVKTSLPAGFSIPREGVQERTPLKGVRKKIAEKMQTSKAVIPHFTLLESADVEQLDELKNSVKNMLQGGEVKITYLSFVMKALLQTIKEFPALNAGIDDVAQEIVIKNYYNFGFAVDTPRGLLVPVVKEVDKKSLTEVSFEIQTLAEKARAGQITPEEMTGGTITITNIGSIGGEYATPIINAPETAILGMYRLCVKPHWDGSAFIPRKTMSFSLTCDHRLIDGAVSARALKFFIQKIENPLGLFI